MYAVKGTDMKISTVIITICLMILTYNPATEGSGCSSGAVDLAVIKPEIKTGFSHAGWFQDKYPNTAKLEGKSKMVVADLKGPGIIRNIHTTRHNITEIGATKAAEELFSRAIVLEIWFDNAKDPAVMCPLADFFGDGCCSDSMNFSSKYIEAAPGSYNCFFPMPFKERAVVILRNDEDVLVGNYSFVEWESLPKWDDSLGYFHATYERRSFRLLQNTRETFLKLEGKGHVIGRQLSVVTDDPAFKNFAYLMEGNNEIDIDEKKCMVEYLGTEDSFGFSWGFTSAFAGLRSGMPLVDISDAEKPMRLSIYRFHDEVPLRFSKSFEWSIDWSNERHCHGAGKEEPPAYWTGIHKQSRDKGACWADFAVVHYWYQDKPGGYKHKPLRDIHERAKQVLHSNKELHLGPSRKTVKLKASEMHMDVGMSKN